MDKNAFGLWYHEEIYILENKIIHDTRPVIIWTPKGEFIPLIKNEYIPQLVKVFTEQGDGKKIQAYIQERLTKQYGEIVIYCDGQELPYKEEINKYRQAGVDFQYYLSEEQTEQVKKLKEA